MKIEDRGKVGIRDFPVRHILRLIVRPAVHIPNVGRRDAVYIYVGYWFNHSYYPIGYMMQKRHEYMYVTAVMYVRYHHASHFLLCSLK